MDPKIDPKSINLGTSKRYLKMTFFGHRNEPKMEKINKESTQRVHREYTECTPRVHGEYTESTRRVHREYTESAQRVR